MEAPGAARFDLSAARASALTAARAWGLQLGEPFAHANVSCVAPAGPAVLKVAWDGDSEALHEHGRFGWAVDPEGTRFEIWEPPPGG